MTFGGRNMKNALLALSLAVALHPAGVRAHHSFASEFDANQPVSLKGVVTKVEFINPHSWIHLEVTAADGTKAVWEVEGGTPNTLFRKGINDSTLPVGTAIAVDGYKARDGSNRMSGRDITLADGRKVFLSGSAPP
jgi:hypothetical protein